MGLKARAYAYHKDYNKAILAAKETIEMSEIEKNNDYVISYKSLIEKWQKLLKE